MQLYDYQVDLITRIRAEMSRGVKHILCQSPTGSGKTIVFSYIVSEMKKRGKRALIITDRIELLTETGGTLREFDLHPYYITAGQMIEPPMQYQVYVAMSQTLRRRIGKWDNFFKSFDVVILDECHKSEFNLYFEQNAFNGAFIIGFSATPERQGKQRQLADDYQVLIEGLQVPELIKRRKLVPDKYFGVQFADMKGVKLNSFGDYQESSMFERFNKRELYSGVVDNWFKYTRDTITLVFCVNIQHSIDTCRKFNEHGIAAKFIVSDVALPQLNDTVSGRIRHERKMQEYDNFCDGYAKYSGERTSVINQWKRGNFKVLVNAGILTTGFNRKDIETIIVNRATTSTILWLQILGRGSRIYPGKTHFNILDFGNNAASLGYYNQERKWSLCHEEKKGGGAMPVKECGKIISKSKTDSRGNVGCGAYVFSSSDICPYCGYIFEHDKIQTFAELMEIDYVSNIVIPEKNFFDELDREAESRGYKFGWIINNIIAKRGALGLEEYAKSHKYQRSWVDITKKRYAKQILEHDQKIIEKNMQKLAIV